MFLTFISYIRDFIKFDSSSAYESTFDKRDRKISLGILRVDYFGQISKLLGKNFGFLLIDNFEASVN